MSPYNTELRSVKLGIPSQQLVSSVNATKISVGQSGTRAYHVLALHPMVSPVYGIAGRTLLRDGEPLTVRGVNYSPLLSWSDRSTSPPDAFLSANKELWDRDLPLIAGMGANTIRIYNWDAGAHVDDISFLDACAEHNLQACVLTRPFVACAHISGLTKLLVVAGHSRHIQLLSGPSRAYSYDRVDRRKPSRSAHVGGVKRGCTWRR